MTHEDSLNSAPLVIPTSSFSRIVLLFFFCPLVFGVEATGETATLWCLKDFVCGKETRGAMETLTRTQASYTYGRSSFWSYRTAKLRSSILDGRAGCCAAVAQAAHL